VFVLLIFINQTHNRNRLILISPAPSNTRSEYPKWIQVADS